MHVLVSRNREPSPPKKNNTTWIVCLLVSLSTNPEHGAQKIDRPMSLAVQAVGDFGAQETRIPLGGLHLLKTSKRQEKHRDMGML